MEHLDYADRARKAEATAAQEKSPEIAKGYRELAETYRALAEQQARMARRWPHPWLSHQPAKRRQAPGGRG
jgi:hypothetical protein